MGTEHKTILTVNCGSSSIKLVLYTIEPLQVRIEVTATNIGQSNGKLTTRRWLEQPQIQALRVSNEKEAISVVLDQIENELPSNNLEAIGHRIVHGGQSFDKPTILTLATIQLLKDLVVFDPEHMPIAISMVEALGKQFPDVTQVACFDTTFYRELPSIARLLPLPRNLETIGLRRYGFHGLSYESLLVSFQKIAGEKAAHGRIILAHLGSGVSLTAVKDGRVLDTTMSFTPASGVPMSTRSGDLDPGIADFLQRKTGMTLEAFNHMVHFESGLLGVSELSPDMELLLQAAASNPKAADAINLFCYQVRKAIGSLTTVLNGVDSIIFAGGMGEHSSAIRDSICEGLEYLGINLDKQRNEANDFLISSDNSQVGVHVIHTDEAAVIAIQTKAVIAHNSDIGEYHGQRTPHA